jgi:hypothetical protein
MARQGFPLTTFYDPSGLPLSYGYVLIYLSKDATASSGQLCAGMTVRVALDASGAMTSVPQLWPNAALAPTDTYYVYGAYTAQGQLVSGPEKVVI